MKTTEVFQMSDAQAVKLPDEFRFADDKVSIRRDGTAVILEPLKPKQWPEDFFDAIRIDDNAFSRPDQGAVPPSPSFD